MREFLPVSPSARKIAVIPVVFSLAMMIVSGDPVEAIAEPESSAVVDLADTSNVIQHQDTDSKSTGPTPASDDPSSGLFMLGNWKLHETDDNFDDYLAELGLGFLRRKMALRMTPVLRVTKESDGFFTFTTETALKTSSFKFRLGEPFVYDTADGYRVKAKATLKGTTLVIEEEAAEGRKPTVIERTFESDRFIAVMTCGSVVSRRVFMKSN